MPTDRDPLDVLRAAWDRVDAPDLPGGDRLADEDPLTRAAVGWTRHAWAAVPVPTPAGLPRRRGRVLRLSFASVAAAAVLLITTAGLWTIEEPSAPGPSDPTPSTVAHAGVADRSAATVPAARTTPPTPDPLVVLLGSEDCVCTPVEPFGNPLPVLPVVAQRSELLESALRAHRSGSWSDAAAKAQLVLDREEVSPEDRLRALCQLALSFQALGQRDQSTAYLSRLEAEISDLRGK